MFLAGADGQTPELRAPSIKGAMRFWWRAMNGHLVVKKDGRWDYSELKRQEGEIFGETSLKSSFSIEVVEKSAIADFSYSGKEYASAIKYFQYSLIHHNDRIGITPGFEFSIRLQSRNNQVLQIAANLVWILANIGGVGTRARRGGGAFSIEEVELDVKDSTAFSLLSKGLLNGSIIAGSVDEPILQYSYLPASSDIFISNAGFKTWEGAMVDIGNRMMQVRDGDTIKAENSIRDRYSYFKERDLDKKAAFGLPLNVRSSNTNRRVDNLVDLLTKNDSNELEKARRASPLYISISKDKSAFYWTVVHLKGEFMPDDAIIKFNDLEWEEENPSLLNEFIQTLNEACEDDFFVNKEPSVKKIVVL